MKIEFGYKVFSNKANSVVSQDASNMYIQIDSGVANKVLIQIFMLMLILITV